MKKQFMSAAALIAVAATAVIGSTAASAAPKETPLKALTPVELADGILFGDGPAASRLAGLGDRPAQHTQKTKRFEREFNKRFMAQPTVDQTLFKTRVESGDALKVESALKTITPMVADAARTVFGASTIANGEAATQSFYQTAKSPLGATSPDGTYVYVESVDWVSVDFAIGAQVGVVVEGLVVAFVAVPAVAASNAESVAIQSTVATIATGLDA